MMLVIRTMLIVISTAVSASAIAKIPLSDAGTGMTCEYVLASARLAWKHEGGDWIDANGVNQGSKAYTSQSVPRVPKAKSVIHWDVTRLAQTWIKGVEPKGALVLRSLLPNDSSAAHFHSRESKKVDLRPLLTINWMDGKKTIALPSADATVSCSSRSGKGSTATLQVGHGRSAILVFPFEIRSSSELHDAKLTLVTEKQFGGTSQIGVFQLDVPWTTNPEQAFGVAADFSGDKGIDQSPDVIFATGFETTSWEREWSRLSRSSNVDLVGEREGNGFHPLQGNALKATVPQGKRMALNLLYKFAEKSNYEPEEAYFRYYIRFGENWNPVVGGKLPGFAGTYDRAGWGMRASDGTNGWSARGSYMSHRSNISGRIPVGSYVYQADMTTRSGSGWGWNQGPTGLLERNRWYSIEQFVRMNQPGKSDGVLKAWIDGKLVFEKTDIRFRDVSHLRIETLWMNVYHGGTEPTDQDISVYIDNVVIAKKYIGPMK